MVTWTFRVSGSATFAKPRGAGPPGNGATGVTLQEISVVGPLGRTPQQTRGVVPPAKSSGASANSSEECL